MLAARGLVPVFVDLETPDLATAEADLEAAVQRSMAK
jgi:dTDP-4-amino-4,6-dideoxygalactose transaminase